MEGKFLKAFRRTSQAADEIYKRVYGQSWTKLPGSKKMWNSYGCNKKAVLVESSTEYLHSLHEVSIREIQYSKTANIDIAKYYSCFSPTSNDALFYPFTVKTNQYAFEQEIRLLTSIEASFDECPTVDIKIPNVTDLILSVTVHPEAEEWYANIVESFCRENGIAFLKDNNRIRKNETTIPFDNYYLSVKSLVLKALHRFYLYDYDLIGSSVNEMTFSARIAMHLFYYLELTFSEYRVDCEYNRLGEEAKKAPEDYSNKTMRPDIIIHKRTLDRERAEDDNLLFIEIKKDDLSQDDRCKIRFACSNSDYNYLNGLGIHSFTRTSVSLSWFNKEQNDFEKPKVYHWDKKQQMLRE